MDSSLIAHIQSELSSSRATIERLENDAPLTIAIAKAGRALIDCYKQGGTVLIGGNGGSAADSQHIAAEFVSRLKFDRAPLPAIALTADTSIVTAIGNDYGFSQLFSRQIAGYGRKGDVFIGITTSGRSENVLKGFETAKALGIMSIALTGEAGLANNTPCDHLLRCPSGSTAKIQECQIIVGHLLCDLVERSLFGNKPAA